MTAINANAPRSVLSLPSTTVSAPVPPAPGSPRAVAPLSVKDTFEAAPAQAAAPKVKTDSLLGPAPDTTKERAALKTALASRDSAAITAAYKALAATTFGVSPDKVNVISDLTKSEAGQINVFIGRGGTESGRTVAAHTVDGATFVPGKQVPVAVVVNAAAFKDSPVSAQKVLFHEGLHLAHATQLAKLDADFRKPGAAKKGETFEKFIDRQKTLSPDQKALMKSLARGETLSTEAVAHVEAFITSFKKYEKHDTKAGRFMNEGSELLALENGAPAKEVAAAEQAHLLTFFKALGPDDQAAMKAVLKDLLKAQPNNWLFKNDALKALAA